MANNNKPLRAVYQSGLTISGEFNWVMIDGEGHRRTAFTELEAKAFEFALSALSDGFGLAATRGHFHAAEREFEIP